MATKTKKTTTDKSTTVKPLSKPDVAKKTRTKDTLSFEAAADRVFKKNHELYKRLAK